MSQAYDLQVIALNAKVQKLEARISELEAALHWYHDNAEFMPETSDRANAISEMETKIRDLLDLPPYEPPDDIPF